MKTKILTFILFGALVVSCSKDFLEVTNPNAKTSAEFWQTEEDLNKAVATVYWAATEMWGPLGEFGVLPDIARTEEFVNTRDDYANYTMNANSGNLGYFWPFTYKGIFYANQIIKFGGDMNIDAGIKNKYVAEAKFFRGLFYLHLVNNWGSVPIYNKLPTDPGDLAKAKSPIDDVWKQVVSDFTEAAADLPETRSASSEIGRVTKGTALAYLGRAYLYQGKWAECQTALEQVVSGGQYKLLDNYADLFDGNHKNNKEAILEVQVANLGGNDDWDIGANRPLVTYLSISYAPGAVGGWESGVVNPALLDSFLTEPTKTNEFDPRATATLAWNYPGCVYFQKNFSTNFGNNVYIRKYTNWQTLSSETMKSTLNYYGMRYADVLLMLAEAYTMQNKISDAAPFVQQIRTRANLADIKNAMSGYTKEKMMSEIRHQRQLELCLEWTHFYDLRRWGLLEQAIKNGINPFKDRYSSKYDYYPIPAAELSANMNMTQNAPW